MSLLMATRDVCRTIGREIVQSFGNSVFRAYRPGYLFEDVRVHMAENGLVALDFQSPDRRVVISADVLRKLADQADSTHSAGGAPIQPVDFQTCDVIREEKAA